VFICVLIAVLPAGHEEQQRNFC